jgi:hypothetical protein
MTIYNGLVRFTIILFMGYYFKTRPTNSRFITAYSKYALMIDKSKEHQEGDVSSSYQKVISSLGMAYDNQGIPGVLTIMRYYTTDHYDCNKKELVIDAIRTKFSHNKGKITGIINSLIGSCCNFDDDDTSSSRTTTKYNCQYDHDDAVEYWNILDNDDQFINDNHHGKPDIVTLSLLYTAIYKTHPANASEILYRAEHYMQHRQQQLKQT